MKMPELDELDLNILKLLKENARMSYSDIGEAVGISRVAVKKRIVSMEQRGVITGYETKILKPESRDSLTFFLDIVSEADRFDAVLKCLKNYPMLREIYVITGECRIRCRGKAANAERLQIFLNQLYRQGNGMKKIECETVLATVKEG